MMRTVGVVLHQYYSTIMIIVVVETRGTTVTKVDCEVMVAPA
jgi:hypothetical protein